MTTSSSGTSIVAADSLCVDSSSDRTDGVGAGSRGPKLSYEKLGSGCGVEKVFLPCSVCVKT